MYETNTNVSTSAILYERRELLVRHVSHVIRPQDPQVAHGSFPLPLHFTHLQKQSIASKIYTQIHSIYYYTLKMISDIIMFIDYNLHN